MDNEITVEELLVIPEENYILIDIRDEYAFSLGQLTDLLIFRKRS